MKKFTHLISVKGDSKVAQGFRAALKAGGPQAATAYLKEVGGRVSLAFYDNPVRPDRWGGGYRGDYGYADDHLGIVIMPLSGKYYGPWFSDRPPKGVFVNMSLGVDYRVDDSQVYLD